MKTTELIVQLPETEAQFLADYAKKHALTLGELLAQYARRLRSREPDISNLNFTGTVPPDADARQEYRDHLENKHR
jgi:hypothetical protein